MRPLGDLILRDLGSYRTYIYYSLIFIISIGFRSQAAKVLKNLQFSLFPIDKPMLPNLDLAVKYVKVNLRSSYEQTMMGRSHLMRRYQVSWKSVHQFLRGRFLKGFFFSFTIYGRGSHFGHVTSIMSINFHFLEPESLHIKFGFDWPSGFWEKPVLSFICNWLWVKVKKWPWTSILTYVHFFSWFQVTGCKCSQKSTFFPFFL